MRRAGRKTVTRVGTAQVPHLSMLPAQDLTAVVAAQSARACPPGLTAVADAVALRFGDSLDAVLFYGSCLRSVDVTDGLVDVYALVDTYRHAYRQRHLRWLNRILPPNVFYLECAFGTARLRVKCTVLSLAAFERGVCKWFHSYLWGRFAQPVRVIRVRDEAVRRRVDEALATAVLTFERRAAACFSAPFSAEALWIAGLRRSYAAELRVEGGSRAAELVAANRADYLARTQASATQLGLRLVDSSGCYGPLTAGRHAVARARFGWIVRCWQGRLLSLPRLAKCAITFHGGVDYAVWKIERHTGVHIEVTPQLRRHPLIYAWPLIFRLIRQGVLH